MFFVIYKRLSQRSALLSAAPSIMQFEADTTIFSVMDLVPAHDFFTIQISGALQAYYTRRLNIETHHFNHGNVIKQHNHKLHRGLSLISLRPRTQHHSLAGVMDLMENQGSTDTLAANIWVQPSVYVYQLRYPSNRGHRRTCLVPNHLSMTSTTDRQGTTFPYWFPTPSSSLKYFIMIDSTRCFWQISNTWMYMFGISFMFCFFAGLWACFKT